MRIQNDDEAKNTPTVARFIYDSLHYTTSHRLRRNFPWSSHVLAQILDICQQVWGQSVGGILVSNTETKQMTCRFIQALCVRMCMCVERHTRWASTERVSRPRNVPRAGGHWTRFRQVEADRNAPPGLATPVKMSAASTWWGFPRKRSGSGTSTKRIIPKSSLNGMYAWWNTIRPYVNQASQIWMIQHNNLMVLA